MAVKGLSKCKKYHEEVYSPVIKHCTSLSALLYFRFYFLLLTYDVIVYVASVKSTLAWPLYAIYSSILVCAMCNVCVCIHTAITITSISLGGVAVLGIGVVVLFTCCKQ